MMAYSPQQVLIPASPPQMAQNPVTMVAAPGITQPAQMATTAGPGQPTQMTTGGPGQPTQMVVAGTTQAVQMATGRPAQPAQMVVAGTTQPVQMATGRPAQPAQMVVAGTTQPVQMLQHPSYVTQGAPSSNMAVASSTVPSQHAQGQIQQSQPSAFVPAPGIRYRSQQVGTPGVTSTQQQQASVVPQSANATVSNPQPQLETSQQPPQSDALVSVGLTASGQFNDQNNLLQNAEA